MRIGWALGYNPQAPARRGQVNPAALLDDQDKLREEGIRSVGPKVFGSAVPYQRQGSCFPELRLQGQTFASHYVMAGGNLAALQRHLGHHSIQQTMAYAHLAPDFAAADLARLNFDPAPPAQVLAFPKRPRRAEL